MIDPDIQKKLDKLRRIEESNRNRSKRFLQKAKSKGLKQLSALVNMTVYREICRRRDASAETGRPLTTGQIIEQAILTMPENGKADAEKDVNANVYKGGNIAVSDKSKTTIEDAIDIDVMPDRGDRAGYREFLKNIIFELDQQPGTREEKAERLNTQGILTARGKKWNKNSLNKAFEVFKKEDQEGDEEDPLEP